MSAIFELNADLREDLGKGASRRMRRLDDKIPAIIYGGGKAPTSISLVHNEVAKATKHESFYSRLLTVTVAGKKEQVILKAIQKHHYKPKVLHMDFQRVKNTDVISMKVPLHFIGAESCVGVKAGGNLSYNAIEIEVRCAANKLPEFIEIDVASLQIEQSIHLEDITLPKDVVAELLRHKQNTTVVSVHAAKKDVVEETTEAAAETAPNDKEKSKEKAGSDKN